MALNQPENDQRLSALKELTKPYDPNNLPVVSIPQTVDFSIDSMGRVKDKTPFEIQKGIPVDKKGKIVIPHNPTLFLINHLFISDDKHTQLYLSDVVTMLCHGFWDEKDEVWKIGKKRLFCKRFIYCVGKICNSKWISAN